MSKIYTVVKTKHRNNSTSEQVGTIAELVEAYGYTLECGASWAHEAGNSKINKLPKTAKSLISNLNRAVNNSAADGYAGVDYAIKTVAPAVREIESDW